MYGIPHPAGAGFGMTVIPDDRYEEAGAIYTEHLFS
jgi:hypothetical protein